MFRLVTMLVGLCVLSSCVPAMATTVGETVLAFWEPDNAYFLGTVVETTNAGFVIVFEDGDMVTLPKAKIRKYDLQVGSAVVARWNDGNYYKGKIAKVVGRTFYIHYDDGDKGWAPWSWIAVK